MSSLVRNLLAVAACAALLAATAWLLDRLAQWQFTIHLRDQAAHALALAARGDTPYRWRFRDSDDLVAGRVFGTDDYAFQNDELVVRSPIGPYEIGLPLARAADTILFPHLQIAAKLDAHAELGLVVRETLSGPELVGTNTTPGVQADDILMDIAKLRWTNGAQMVAPPSSAAMLRLRVQMPAGKQLRMRSAALNRLQGAERIDLSQLPEVIDPDTETEKGIKVYRLPFRQETQKVDIDAIARVADPHQPVLIVLPQRGRLEQQIDLRNAVFAAFPGAILIPEAALEASFARARMEATERPRSRNAGLRWFLVAIYAIGLAYFRARAPSRPRLRALTEIALAMAGPLWLLLGEGFDGNPHAWQEALIATSLIYAVSLSMPRNWRWMGSARAWLFAFAIVAFAGFLGLLAHQSGEVRHPIGLGHVARYLAWAALQQYLICVVCTERWRVVTGNGVLAIYLGALGFALLHMPNATLMIATFVGGLGWCALYLRERALLPLAFSHAASALLLLALLPHEILRSAEVSVRFFQ